jgi:hypothetical protein
MAMTLQQILQMMRTPQPSGLGQVSDVESEAMRAAIAGAGSTGIPTPPVDTNAMQREIIEAYRKGGQAGMGQVSNAEAAVMGGLSAGIPAAAPAQQMSPLEQVRKAMEARQLSLPAAEGMPNYADGQAPLSVGGGLLADEAQMLMNTAYDMSAPREMRINAIERLRVLGAI